MTDEQGAGRPAPAYLRPVARLRQRGGSPRKTFTLAELIVIRNSLLMRRDVLEAGGLGWDRDTTEDAVSVVDTLMEGLGA